MDGPTFAVHIALEASGFESVASGVTSSAAAMGSALADLGAGVELLQGAVANLVERLGALEGGAVGAAVGVTDAGAAEAAAAARAAEFVAATQNATARLREKLAALQQGAAAERAYEVAEQARVLIERAGVGVTEEQAAALREEAAAQVELRAQIAATAEETSFLSEILGTLGQALKYTLAYGALFAGWTLFKDAIASEFEFENSLTRLRTLAGASAEEVDRMRESIRSISLATGQSADDNTKAAFAIESAGLRGQAALDALRQSAEAAAIGLGDQTTVARAAVAAVTAYGEANLSTKQAIGVLIDTAKLGNVQVETLAGSLGRVTAIAAAVGVGFDQVGAAVAGMTRLGVSADQAVTALRSTLGLLELKESKGAEKALQSVGLSVAALRQEIHDKGLAAALVDLVDRFKGNDTELAKLIPNIRALAEVLSNAKSQGTAYVQIAQQIHGEMNTALDDATKLNEANPAHQWELFKAAAGEAGRQLAEGLLPALVSITESMAEFAKSMDLKATGQALGAVLKFLADNMWAFKIAVEAYLILKLPAALIAARDAMVAFNYAALLNPFAITVVAVLALGKGLEYLIDKWRASSEAAIANDVAVSHNRQVVHDLAEQYRTLADGATSFARSASPLLEQVSLINIKFEEQIKAAKGNAGAIHEAEQTRADAIRSAKQHEQALIDEAAAALKDQAAQEQLLKTMLARETAKAGSLVREGLAHGVDVRHPNDYAKMMGADIAYNEQIAAVQNLMNQIKILDSEQERGQKVLDDRVKALGSVKDATVGLATTTDKASKSEINYRVEAEKLVSQARLHLQAARDTFNATSLGTAALEAQRVETARLAGEQKGLELNARAASKGLSIDPNLPRVLGDAAAATEAWNISLGKLKTSQQDAEKAAADLAQPLAAVYDQLQYLQNSRWFTVGIPPATINSSQEWGKTLVQIGFGINALKLRLDDLNRSNPQTIALTKQLADGQALYQKALAESATQLAEFRAKLEQSAVTGAADAAREIQIIRDRVAATKEGGAALQVYDILLNAHNEALRIESLLVQQVGESDIDYAKRRVQTYLDAFHALDTETDTSKARTDDFLSTLESVFQIMATGFGGASTQMGKLAADMGKLVTAIKAVGDAQGRTNKILAAAQVVQGIGAALADLNVGGAGKTGGPQALGGRLDSNYAGIGSLVGTIIGAIVGAYFNAPTAGAAVGGALGSVLGSLISKAGDSASASLTSAGNVVVGETSRQLDGAVKDALTNIFKGLQAEMAKLGLLLQGIPLIDIKVRDNIVRVIVGGVVRTFSSMQDAISFGIAEALKQTAGGAGGHLPPEVVAALKNTTATDLQALQSDIDFAFSIANYGVPKVVQAIDKSVSDFFVTMQRAASLGIDQGKVVAQFADQIKAQKDAILGIDRNLSPADQMRHDADAFNQKMKMLKAQEEADKADLEIKRADLVIKIELLKTSTGITKATLDMVKDAEAALAQVDLAIAETQAVIDSIVTISDSELQAALARLGRGGKGGGGGDALGSLQQMIDEVGKSVRQSGMSDLQKQLDDINQKWKEAVGSVHSHGNAEAAAARERDAALKAAAKLDKDKQAAAIKAANERYNKEIAGIHRTQAALDAANAARQQEINLLARDLRDRVGSFVGTGAPGQDVRDALDAIDAQAKGLIADARALAKEKGLTPAELRKMVEDVRGAAERQMRAVTQGVLDSVGKFLGDDGPSGLIGKVDGVTESARGLIDGLTVLKEKGQITTAQFDDLAKKIEAAVPQQQRDIIGGAVSSLFGDLYDLLGMDKEAAQLKYDLAIAELNAKRAELEAAMKVAGYTQEAMDAVLKPLGELIGKVVAAGPSLFESGGSGGGRYGSGTWVNPNTGQVVDTGGGGGAGSTGASDAQERINSYLDLALSPFQRSLKSLNAEFDKYRAALGNTAQVQQAYALALHELVTQQLQGLKEYLDGMLAGSDSPLKAEDQLALVKQQIADALAKANAGDASQGDVLAKLVQQTLQLQQQISPEAGSAYRDLFTQLNLMLQGVWKMFNEGGAPVAPPALGDVIGGGGLPGGSPLGDSLPGAGILGSGQGAQLVVNFLPVIQQMQLSTTMLQGSMSRIETQASRGADASERAARALESDGSLYRKVS